MALALLLENLFSDGKAMVDAPGVLEAGDLRECRAILEREELKVRTEFPGRAPTLNLAVATWAAETFGRMCQLAIFRATSAEMVAAAFGEKCPEGASAEKHYAIDLTWRFFPDLYRFAHAAAADDPLVKAMEHAAGEWPLSSVGVAGRTDVVFERIEEILGHEGLRRVFLDRVIAKRDTAWLANPKVLSGVLASVGMHTSLIADWKRTWPREILDTCG